MKMHSLEDKHGCVSNVQRMISSCSGAFITSFLVTPLDVVKTRLQVQQKPMLRGKWDCFIYCNGLMDHLCPCPNGNGTGSSPHWYKIPIPYKLNGTLDAFVKIARYEGVARLWSGLPPTLLMAVPATMIYFTTYDSLKDWLLAQNTIHPSWIVPVMSGAISRIFAASLISPIELARTKMQSKSLTYSELKQAVFNTVHNNGILSLWRGLGATLLRDVPFSALYWYHYEFIRSTLVCRNNLSEPTFTISFTAGAISGTIAGILTLPFDVIKTHKQIELGSRDVLLNKKPPSSTWSLMRQLKREKGTRALFAGLTPRIVKVAPACAIMISSYEMGKQFFMSRNALSLQLSDYSGH